jgi:hypothetical protein
MGSTPYNARLMSDDKVGSAPRGEQLSRVQNLWDKKKVYDATMEGLGMENVSLVLRFFYVMQKHHPTPQIMNPERSTLTTAAFTPN